MADQYTVVTKKSWGSNILDSFVGALIGLLLFLISFLVLWNNEGTVDFSRVARTSVPVTVTAVDPAANGKLASLSGQLSTSDLVGDTVYLKPGNYVQLSRRVEMFAWQEKSKSETKDAMGGGSETKTTYTYVKDWTANPRATSDFKLPAGHTNPPLSVQSLTFTAVSARIGVYTLDPQTMELPKPADLRLSEALVLPGNKLAGNYLYVGSGSLQAPQVGDVRIAYGVIENKLNVTAFGKLENDHLAPFIHQGKDRLYRAVRGTRDEAIAQLAAEHKALVWTVRLVGFLLMWGGLFLCFGPLNAILKVLPWLGTAGRWLTGAVTFPAALVLSAVTILIAIVAHNIWLLIAVLAGLGALVYWTRTQRKP
jgi:hypothetical protein